MLHVNIDTYEAFNGTITFYATSDETLNVLHPNYIYPYRIEYNTKKLIWDIYLVNRNKYVYDLPDEIIIELTQSDFPKMWSVIKRFK